MGLLVDIPKPRAWPPPQVGTQAYKKLLAYSAKRDPVGDKVHTWFACLFLFCLPLATAPASISMALLFGYSLLRLPTTWRTLTPLIRSKAYLALFAWVLYSTISIAWSSDKTQGWDHVESMWLMAIPIPILLWPILRKWKWLLAAGLIGVFLQNTLQISELIGSWFLDGDDWISIVKNKFREDKIVVYFARPIGLDNHEGNGSLFIAMATFIWISLLIGKQIRPALIIPPLLFAIIGVVVAQSRAVWMGFGFAIVVFSVMCIRNKLVTRRVVVLTALSIFVVGAAAVFTLPSSYFGRIIEIQKAATDYFEEGTVNTGIDERLNWYTTEFKQSFEQPLFKNVLVGHGLGSTSEIDFSVEGQPVLETTVHPHNAYIQILYEGGLIGLGLFVYMLFKVACSAHSNKNIVIQITGVSCVILWAGTAFFDGGQNSGRVLALLMVIAVLISTQRNLYKGSTR